MDGGDTIYSDLLKRDDLLYGDIYYNIFIFVLSLDVKLRQGLKLFFEKKSFAKETSLKRKTEVNSDFSF